MSDHWKTLALLDSQSHQGKRRTFNVRFLFIRSGIAQQAKVGDRLVKTHEGIHINVVNHSPEKHLPGHRTVNWPLTSFINT